MEKTLSFTVVVALDAASATFSVIVADFSSEGLGVSVTPVVTFSVSSLT
jgi:hypothetical protein